jgi:signal transduction histidine kinase
VPFGIAAWVFYLIPIVYSIFIDNKKAIILTTILSTFFLLLQLVACDYAISYVYAVINRLCYILVNWVVAYIGIKFIDEKIKLAKSQEELKEQNVELEQFAYVASHDLKSPLRAINNLASWIKEDYKDIPAEMDERLNLMISRISYMNELIDGLLEYSRIGRVNTEKEEIDLNVILEEVKRSLDIKNFKISVYSLPKIVANRVRIKQIFMNLVDNAIKHHDKGFGNIEVNYENGIFFVGDDGPGIDPKYHEKVFIIFQTLKPKKTTGLGLTLVKKIVEEYDGKIWIESEGRGTKICFNGVFNENF